MDEVVCTKHLNYPWSLLPCSKLGGFTLLPLQIHQGLWESISASEVGLSREAASARGGASQCLRPLCC